ncbi:MAG: type II toxin-antitoxin system VapC family toxin [Anaerolineae bacterium]
MLTLYLDTSALLKRYIHEAGALEVSDLLAGAEELATSVLTRVETASALARLVFLQSILPPERERVWSEFSEDWQVITRLHITAEVIERAATLAQQYILRGYDAVHLASALLWQEKINLPVTLATFDRQLWKAAQNTQMNVWPENL